MNSKEDYNRQLEAAIKALLELNNQPELDLLVKRGVYRSDDGYTLPLMRLISIIAGAHPNFRMYYQESFSQGATPDAIRSFLFKCSQDTQAIAQERLIQQDQTPAQDAHPVPQQQVSEVLGPDLIDQGVNKLVWNFKKSAVAKVAEHDKALKVETGELLYLKEGEKPPDDYKGRVITLKEGENPPKKLSKYEEFFYNTIKTKRELDYRLRQFDNKLDQRPDVTLVDYALEQAQYQARLKLKTFAQQELLGKYVNPFLERQVGKLFSKVFPNLGAGAETAASGTASTAASTLGGAAEGLTSAAGGTFGGIASAAGGLATSTASTVIGGAASAAAAVTAPISGIVIAVIAAIAIIVFIVFYFYPNTFAVYNPVPIPESLVVVPPGSGGSLPPPGSSNSTIVNWALQIANALRIGPYVDPSCGCTAYDQMEANISNGSYSAVDREGINPDTTPEGLYWCTNLVIDSYQLSGIGGLGSNQQGVINMLSFWQNTPGYNFYDYQKNSQQSVLQSVQTGMVMFLAMDRNNSTGQEHVSIVSGISVDSNGNGTITTLNSNSTNIIITFTVANWVVQNPFYPVVGFGGHS